MALCLSALKADKKAFEDERLAAAGWFHPDWVNSIARCAVCFERDEVIQPRYGTLDCEAIPRRDSAYHRTKQAQNRWARLKLTGRLERPCAGPCCCVCERCLLRVVAHKVMLMDAEEYYEPLPSSFETPVPSPVPSPRGSPRRTSRSESPSRAVRQRLMGNLDDAIEMYVENLANSHLFGQGFEAYGHLSSSGVSYLILPLVTVAQQLEPAPVVLSRDVIGFERSMSWNHAEAVALVVSRPILADDGETHYVSICSSLAGEDSYNLEVMEQWMEFAMVDTSTCAEVLTSQREVSLFTDIPVNTD